MLAEMTFEEYRDWLLKPSPNGLPNPIIPQSILPMGPIETATHVAYVECLMFHWTLKTSEIGNLQEYKGRWCYEGSSPIRALAALVEWKSRDFEGEPGGWRRHPETGRRRNDDGDPESEHGGW